jgi:hypothetical protein
MYSKKIEDCGRKAKDLNWRLLLENGSDHVLISLAISTDGDFIPKK